MATHAVLPPHVVLKAEPVNMCRLLRERSMCDLLSGSVAFVLAWLSNVAQPAGLMHRLEKALGKQPSLLSHRGRKKKDFIDFTHTKGHILVHA